VDASIDRPVREHGPARLAAGRRRQAGLYASFVNAKSATRVGSSDSRDGGRRRATSATAPLAACPAQAGLFLAAVVVFATEVVAAVVVVVAVIAVLATVIIVFLFAPVVAVAFELIATIVVVVAVISFLAAVVAIVLFLAPVVAVAFEFIAAVIVVVAVIAVFAAVRGGGLRQGVAGADGRKRSGGQTGDQQFERVAPGGPVELLRPPIEPASIHRSSSVVGDLHEERRDRARLDAQPSGAIADRVGDQPARRG
jgi:hypothetical protein